MGFNYISTFYLLLILNIRVWLLALPLVLVSGSANMPDFASRVLTDDAYLNTYYFFWTNFWYLPVFFTAVLFSINVLNTTPAYELTLNFILLTFVSVVFCENMEYIWNNQHLHTWVLDAVNFNVLLSNSINKYHPYMLYVGLICIIITVLRVSGVGAYNLNRFLRAKQSLGADNSGPQPINILLTALYLGSWWAVQEGSWGGWWNWDPSEVFGLTAAAFFISQLHIGLVSNLHNSGEVYTKVFLSFVVMLYVFIQINFDLVSHNFGTNFNIFADPLYTYICVFGFFTINLFSLLSSSLLNYSRYLVNYTRTTRVISSNRLLHNQLLVPLFAGLLYLSFIILLNDFIWKFVGLNVWNNVYGYGWLLLGLAFHTVIRLWGANSYGSVLVLSALPAEPNAVILLLVLLTWVFGVVYWNHIFILIFLIINLLNTTKVSNFWLVDTQSTVCVQNNLPATSFNPYISYTNSILEILTPSLVGNNNNDSAWGFVFGDTSPESNTFHHLVTSAGSEQWLHVGHNIFTFSINSLDNSLIVVTFLFILTAACWSVYSYNNNVIVF